MASYAISALCATLAREIPSVLTIHVKLGTFDLGHHKQDKNSSRADILSWSPSLRAAYSSNYRSYVDKPIPNRVKGSNIKELYHCVFDALTDKRPRSVVSVGAGVWIYEFLGRVLPEPVLRYLLKIKGKDDGWEIVES